MCKKMGLGQQALADALEMKRGKVAGYFYETQAKPDFHEKLGKRFDLNVGRFLTVEMEDANYDSFFSNRSNNQLGLKNEGFFSKKSDLIDLLVQLKSIENKSERNLLIDDMIKLYGKVLDENNRLKDDLILITKKLLQK